MFFKTIKPKGFNYVPRFYDPEKDPELKRRQRLGFNRNRAHKRKVKSPIYWLLLIGGVIFIYLKFTGAF